eukprot:CAMPEP_0115328744 /NCGR_PEP_ID=MMETSP0270-20121206/84844_1 /TAXON_ID=71861 /ORGANISM="Scrippsiella trochoidea, Strain CCMP3099" /LENGTH=94 /DNA_ID=CAMNT_0002749287 /DNA_START=319 /DNA_END=603 /DNA_ORIENTATION=-
MNQRPSQHPHCRSSFSATFSASETKAEVYSTWQQHLISTASSPSISKLSRPTSHGKQKQDSSKLYQNEVLTPKASCTRPVIIARTTAVRQKKGE